MSSDELSLIYGVRELQDTLSESIRRGWPRGIQRIEQPDPDLTVFHLKGKPFSTGFASSSRSIALARLMCAILEDTMRRGWSMRAMINLHRQSKTESVLLALDFDIIYRPPVMAVALCSSDQINLVALPMYLHDRLTAIVEKHWPQGISSTKTVSEGRDFSLETKRWPFRAHDIGDNLCNSRMIILDLLREIYAAGLVFYGAGHPQRSIEEVSTLFFVTSAKEGPPQQMFLMGPHRSDYLVTWDAPSNCVAALNQCIMENWSRQIQREEDVGCMHVTKLKGYPFHSSGFNSIEITRTMIRIFETYKRMGWCIGATIDITKSIDDASTFLMISCAPADVSIMAVRLSGVRCLTVINAPREAQDAVRVELNAAIPGSVQETDNNGCPKFCLDRNISNAQAVICLVVSRLESMGWKLVSSADLSVKYGQSKDHKWPEDLHTMFFEKASNQ